MSCFVVVQSKGLLNCYLVQDPGTKPAKRVWTSINVGTEIYVSSKGETAEWTVSDFDVLVPEDTTDDGEGFF
ncbi:hypothetical protein CK203_096788 [Vitis vinifera]|uniref:DUF7705 domain-containing protein n=1 Tax=Vitis vinifera TaxID=29760 RepID=A0A438D138_VITVI|nr:hypothetical protein CK203_096788 [Vitis vinifera]